MRIRSLIIGTILAFIFWGLTQLFPGARPRHFADRDDPDRSPAEVQQAMTYDLLVTFRNRLPREGQLILRLYQDTDSFSNRSGPRGETLINLEFSDEVLWAFRGLPVGEYAVEAIHDANENGKLDQGERVMYSNWSPESAELPEFANCQFTVDQNRAIELD